MCFAFCVRVYLEGKVLTIFYRQKSDKQPFNSKLKGKNIIKKWFQNLDKKYKTLIHILLAIIIWIVIPCSSNDNTPAFVYLLWITLIALEIVFIIWSVKRKPAQNSTDNKPATSYIEHPTQTKQIEFQSPIKEQIEKQTPKLKECKINSINNDFIKIKVGKIAKSKIERYDLMGIIPVSISSDFDNFTDNIYITTSVEYETKDGYDYKDIRLTTLSKSAIEELNKFMSYRMESKYLIMDAELDIEECELIIPIPYDLQDKNLPIYTKLVGVTFENRQEYLKSVYVDDLLILEHKPVEQHKNAISVIHATTNNILGFIKKELADDLISKYGIASSFYGVITEKTGGNGQSLGCNIQIVRKKN